HQRADPAADEAAVRAVVVRRHVGADHRAQAAVDQGAHQAAVAGLLLAARIAAAVVAVLAVGLRLGGHAYRAQRSRAGDGRDQALGESLTVHLIPLSNAPCGPWTALVPDYGRRYLNGP